MKKLQPTEYMYASARIRSLENRIVGREKLESLIEARSTEDAMARLAEYGITPTDVETYGSAVSVGEARSRAREAMLLTLLREAFSEAEQAVPDPSVFRYLRYPYDCNNIKAAIKCAIRGIDAGDMLFDFGTVPADKLEDMIREGNYEALPPALAAAIPRPAPPTTVPQTPAALIRCWIAPATPIWPPPPLPRGTRPSSPGCRSRST